MKWHLKSIKQFVEIMIYYEVSRNAETVQESYLTRQNQRRKKLKFCNNIFKSKIYILNLLQTLQINDEWWWIVFVVWLTDERGLASFPAWTIVRDPHHNDLQHIVSRIWTRTEPEFRLYWMKLCSSDNCYTMVPLDSYSLKALSFDRIIKLGNLFKFLLILN